MKLGELCWFVFETGALYVALAVLKLIEIHRPLIPKCWDRRYLLPCCIMVNCLDCLQSKITGKH